MCKLCRKDRRPYTPTGITYPTRFRKKSGGKVRTVYPGVCERVGSTGKRVYYCTITRECETFTKTTDKKDEAISFVDSFGETPNNKRKCSYYAETVKDYTGEYPCVDCVRGSGLSRTNDDNTIDDMIIKKLFTVYTKDMRRELINAQACLYRLDQDQVVEKISNNIQAIVNNNTGSVRFRVVIKGIHVSVDKTFDSISEAVECRDKYVAIKNKNKRKKGVETKKYMESFIIKNTRTTTDHVSYGVKITRKGTEVSKVFSTIEEARIFKDTVLSSRDISKYGIPVKTKRATKTVSKHIIEIIGKDISYNVKITIDKVLFTKSFKTKREAEKFRDKHIQPPKKPKSGYYGVMENHNKWAVRISTGKSTSIRLGQYSTKIEAAIIYDRYVISHKIDKPINNIEEKINV